MEKLIEIAKKILAANSDAYLSGSLALRLQGHATRREPEDIDIWIPDNIIKVIPGMRVYSSSERYDEGTHLRESYVIDGEQVDFFYPTENPEFTPLVTYADGITCVLAEDILKFKTEHAMDTEYEGGRGKHLEDLIFFFQKQKEKLDSFNETFNPQSLS